MREIDDIKSKLDGLSWRDFLASISFFKEGVDQSNEVFDKAKFGNGYKGETAQAVFTETLSLTEGMRNLGLYTWMNQRRESSVKRRNHLEILKVKQHCPSTMKL